MTGRQPPDTAERRPLGRGGALEIASQKFYNGTESACHSIGGGG